LAVPTLSKSLQTLRDYDEIKQPQSKIDYKKGPIGTQQKVIGIGKISLFPPVGSLASGSFRACMRDFGRIARHSRRIPKS
jgi:hypothetical protein